MQTSEETYQQVKEPPQPKDEDQIIGELIHDLWTQYHDIIAKDEMTLGQLKGVQHNIYLKTLEPVYSKPI